MLHGFHGSFVWFPHDFFSRPSISSFPVLSAFFGIAFPIYQCAVTGSYRHELKYSSMNHKTDAMLLFLFPDLIACLNFHEQTLPRVSLPVEKKKLLPVLFLIF